MEKKRKSYSEEFRRQMVRPRVFGGSDDYLTAYAISEKLFSGNYRSLLLVSLDTCEHQTAFGNP